MHASRRTGNPRFGSGKADTPNIEVAAALLEWRRGEQHVYEAPRVRFELPSHGSRVAVSQDQQVDFGCGIPFLLACDHGPRTSICPNAFHRRFSADCPAMVPAR